MKYVNDNLREYKSIRVIIVFPIFMLLIGVLFVILTIVKNQFTASAILPLAFFIFPWIFFIRYLIRFSNTRYYEISVDEINTTLLRNDKKRILDNKEIVSCVVYKMDDISGNTIYFKIKTKGFKSNILISNYNKKDKDTFITLCDYYNKLGLNVVEVNGNLLSQLLLLLSFTFGK